MKNKAKAKINVVTLGCSKNLVDSEKLMGQLHANKIEVVHDSNEPADVVVINTCGFISDAKEESIDTILEYVEAKRLGLFKKVYVVGCLSQRYKNDLIKEIEHVDGFYGIDAMPDIVKELGAKYHENQTDDRLLTTPSHYAYLKVSEGCDRACSFCAIPFIRGKFRSRPIEELVQEARLLISKGVKEIMLIAQDLTYYGNDLYKKRELAKLLNQLAEINGLQWLRLQYMYPANFPMEVLDVINGHENICNYIDLPLQHISDPILKSMKRTINKKQTLELLDFIRNKIPGAAVRTSLIVGYPGETEQQFNELLSFIQQQRFDRLGVFTYSHEENTSAYKLKDDVPEALKIKRFDEIMEIQQNISLQKNQEKIGQKLNVLVDRQEGDYLVGRTEFDSPEVDNEVLMLPGEKVRPGDFYQALITEADFYDLYAVAM